MANPFLKYARWLHTGQPAGEVEALPVVAPDGSTRIPGLYVAGALTGIPLLKSAADTGARVVDRIATRAAALAPNTEPGCELLIVGAGVAGMSAALRARELGLAFEVCEAREPFSTIADFPRAKPIYTYPEGMEPAGELRLTADVKEDLLEDLRTQTQGIEVATGVARRVVKEHDGLSVEFEDGSHRRARHVLVALGRSGEFRQLGVEGEGLEHVHHQLFDPHAFAGETCLVVGGGDSAVETAVALAKAGARCTLSYRGARLHRPKPENLRALTSSTVELQCESEVERIDPAVVRLSTPTGSREVPARTVFVMIGREAPLEFFRRSGVPVRGDWGWRRGAILALLLIAAVFLYHWKSNAGPGLQGWFVDRGWFPFSIPDPADPASVAGTLRLSMQSPAFWYSLAYSVVVTIFGVVRIRRRRTPYITRQTLSLTLIQVLPLFLLPFLILPWLGHNGFFDAGWRQWMADELFPVTQWDTQGREYWRSVGFILAWPLMIWNVFTSQPLKLWLVISLVQTFVLIPLLVRRWGKGAYCGWICSCGALAETLGDGVRDRMPHGRVANRLNLIGQVLLGVVLLLLALRVVSWLLPAGTVGRWSETVYLAAAMGQAADGSALGGWGAFLNYAWSVDLLLAGVLGVGLYAHFSGRTWCRFGCPLAALMNLYARLGTQFRIFADAKRCISCNLCTTNCHQGIDVMHFAQQGQPMDDPQCVRCSACVESCPTVTLEFGRVDPASGEELGRDRWAANRAQEPVES